MEQKMETTIMDYIGTTIRMPKGSLGLKVQNLTSRTEGLGCFTLNPETPRTRGFRV